MHKLVSMLFLVLLMFTSCDKTNDDVQPDDDNDIITDDGDPGNGDPVAPITTDVRLFIFGHSLINHELLVNQTTPSNETAVPHWMHFLAEAAQYDYAANGQYGFLPQHRNLPPISQWGFDHVNSIWDSDMQDFEEANFNTILLTAANFIQWQPPSEDFYQEDFTPAEATTEIFEWCRSQESEVNLYIYENWPDMSPYLAGAFPNVADQEWANYNNYTLGEFHQWWLDYHDLVIAAMPEANVKMIPVGPILAKLLTEMDELVAIPVADLYEDDAPHGRPTIYFLAGLITYMAMYGTEAPENYTVPSTVHENVQENYTAIGNFIWTELEAFDFSDGDSRVFLGE